GSGGELRVAQPWARAGRTAGVVARRRVHRNGPSRLAVEKAGAADRRAAEEHVVNNHAVAGDRVVVLRARAEGLHTRFNGEVAGRRSGPRAQVAGDADLDQLLVGADG